MKSAAPIDRFLVLVKSNLLCSIGPMDPAVRGGAGRGETDLAPQGAARLEVTGWFGVVASAHWLASQAAMGVLERGGNAFDAAVTGGLVMQVAQPHLNGPAGDVSLLMRLGGDGRVLSLSGQGPTPRAATIEQFAALGLDLIPGTGLLPAVVPGAFDAWMHLLVTHGTIGLTEALAPAILYAKRGVPVNERLHRTLSAAAPIFARDWPTSAALFLQGGQDVPEEGGTFKNPQLAATWARLLKEACQTTSDRDGQIEAARAIWSNGFVAEAIDTFCAQTRVMDVSGQHHGAFLTGEDLAGWRATFEAPRSITFAGRTVHKCGAWTQGPALLEALGILSGDDIGELDPLGALFVHRLTEAVKLALADRDAHGGVSGPGGEVAAQTTLDALLSEPYLAARRALLSQDASHAFRPGHLGEDDWWPDFEAASLRRREAGLLAAYGGGEPTTGPVAMPVDDSAAPAMPDYLARAVGDTSYLAVADREGNVVSATPSGGWLQSSPAIGALGFPLGTRAQMMWLDEASPSRLAPAARPRTTLTPTIVTDETSGAALAVGTPGGDQQEQWQLAFLVRHLVHGMGLQEALDAPAFHTNHLINSFYPRGAIPGSLVVEDRFADDAIADLSARGHAIDVGGGWSEGRLCAVALDADGSLSAAATPRGGQGLAVGR